MTQERIDEICSTPYGSQLMEVYVTSDDQWFASESEAIKHSDELGGDTQSFEVWVPTWLMDKRVKIYTGNEFPAYVGQEILVEDDHSDPDNPCYKISFDNGRSWDDNMGDEDWGYKNEQPECSITSVDNLHLHVNRYGENLGKKYLGKSETEGDGK